MLLRRSTAAIAALAIHGIDADAELSPALEAELKTLIGHTGQA